MPDGAEYKPAVATLTAKCKYLSVRTDSPVRHQSSASQYGLEGSDQDIGLKNSGFRSAIYRYITPIDFIQECIARESESSEFILAYLTHG